VESELIAEEIVRAPDTPSPVDSCDEDDVARSGTTPVVHATVDEDELKDMVETVTEASPDEVVGLTLDRRGRGTSTSAGRHVAGVPKGGIAGAGREHTDAGEAFLLDDAEFSHGIEVAVLETGVIDLDADATSHFVRNVDFLPFELSMIELTPGRPKDTCRS
jgi:hypothetical protein